MFSIRSLLIRIVCFSFVFICSNVNAQTKNDVLLDSFQVMINQDKVVEFLKITSQDEWEYFLNRFDKQPRKIDLKGIEISGISGSEFGRSKMLSFVEFLKTSAQNLEYFSWEGPIETDFSAKEMRALFSYLQQCPIQQFQWKNMPISVFSGYNSLWKEFHAVVSKIPSVSFRGTLISDIQDTIGRYVWTEVQALDLSDTEIKSYFIHSITTSSFPKLQTLITEGMTFSNKFRFKGDFPVLKTWSLAGLKTDSDQELQSFVKIYYSALSQCENVYFPLTVRASSIFKSDNEEIPPFIVSKKDTMQWHNAIASYNPLDTLPLFGETGYFSRPKRIQFVGGKINTGRNGWLLADTSDFSLFLNRSEFNEVTQVSVGGKISDSQLRTFLKNATHLSVVYLVNTSFNQTTFREIQNQFPEKRLVQISIIGVSPKDTNVPGADPAMQKWMRDQMKNNIKIPDMPKIHR